MMAGMLLAATDFHEMDVVRYAANSEFVGQRTPSSAARSNALNTRASRVNAFSPIAFLSFKMIRLL